tara:strand:- start:335 stop:478 length:144 start_codon:yes stop_codon:yes gene_type:complete
MAKRFKQPTQSYEPIFKRTQLSVHNPKTSSMNKSKKHNFKLYRGQGR